MLQDTNTTSAILAPSQNCWRVAHAERAAFLVDAEAYFTAFRAAAINARHTIFIIGWDVNSLARLTPRQIDDYPPRLGEFLNTLVRRRRSLHVYVLNWDFIVFYAPDREAMPTYKLGWRTHRRVHFRLDSAHPVGASHHQKIVVIDDAVAFVGGIDLTDQRWDTPGHTPNDPRRRDRNGNLYPPFHDVQMMVDGDAAAAVGELARERWRRAGGKRPEPAEHSAANQPWPVDPDLLDVDVGIARTEPRYRNYPQVSEIRRLYVDAIAAARESIYIENQYFTSRVIGAALADALRAPSGPDVVVVLRLRGGGWLEHNTMATMRARLLEDVRQADAHGRLRVYYADHEDFGDDCLYLHSKLLIVDGRFVSVGSANLNNRSLGLDTECNLAIDGQTPRARRGITALRNRLLAEHLGVTPDAVEQAIARADGSLMAGVESLRGNVRTLRPLPGKSAADVDAFIPVSSVLDPPEPFDPDRIVDEFTTVDGREHAGWHLTAIAGFVAVLAALAAAWRWTALGDWIDVNTLLSTANSLQGYASAPLWVIGVYVLASLTAFPITVLIVVTALVFGPLLGLIYAVVGSLLGAAASFGLGQWLGRSTVRRLAGKRINELSRRLGRRGLLAALLVRIFPVAPFTIVNLVAGASHMRFRDFVLGTALGMAPGILAITVFADRLAAMVRNPSPTALATLIGVGVVIVAGAVGMRFWFKRREAKTAPESGRSKRSEPTWR